VRTERGVVGWRFGYKGIRLFFGCQASRIAEAGEICVVRKGLVLKMDITCLARHEAGACSSHSDRTEAGVDAPLRACFAVLSEWLSCLDTRI
jgi:hypothetical protein